jgi:hypothetical protein
VVSFQFVGPSYERSKEWIKMVDSGRLKVPTLRFIDIQTVLCINKAPNIITKWTKNKKNK